MFNLKVEKVTSKNRQAWIKLVDDNGIYVALIHCVNEGVAKKARNACRVFITENDTETYHAVAKIDLEKEAKYKDWDRLLGVKNGKIEPKPRWR